MATPKSHSTPHPKTFEELEAEREELWLANLSEAIDFVGVDMMKIEERLAGIDTEFAETMFDLVQTMKKHKVHNETTVKEAINTLFCPLQEKFHTFTGSQKYF